MIVNKRPMIGFTPFGHPLKWCVFGWKCISQGQTIITMKVIAMFCGSTNWLIRIRIGKQIKIRYIRGE